jgi:hypothetical protein
MAPDPWAAHLGQTATAGGSVGGALQSGGPPWMGAPMGQQEALKTKDFAHIDVFNGDLGHSPD